MPGPLKRDKMVEQHKEENGEPRGRERERTDRGTAGKNSRDRRRESKSERERERERKEAALLLFHTMTGNVAKDSSIVRQDTVQYTEFRGETVCSQMEMWTEVIGGGPDCRVTIGHIHRGTPRQHERGENECEQKER